MSRVSLLLLAVLAGGSCSTKNAAPDPASSSEHGESQEPKPEPRERSIPVQLDGTEVARVSPGALAQPRSLASIAELPPRREWIRVDAISPDGRSLRIPLASGSYDDHEPQLYLHKNRRPAIGWFVRSADGALADRPRLKLVDLSSIDIVSVPEEPAEDRARLAIELDGAARPALTLRRLGELAAPADEHAGTQRGERKKTSEWPLAAVIDGVAPGGEIASMQARAADGETIEITAEQWQEGEYLLKLNRQGQFLVRWKGPSGKRQELRDLQGLSLRTKAMANSRKPK